MSPLLLHGSLHENLGLGFDGRALVQALTGSRSARWAHLVALTLRVLRVLTIGVLLQVLAEMVLTLTL